MITNHPLFWATYANIMALHYPKISMESIRDMAEVRTRRALDALDPPDAVHAGYSGPVQSAGILSAGQTDYRGDAVHAKWGPVVYGVAGQPEAECPESPVILKALLAMAEQRIADQRSIILSLEKKIADEKPALLSELEAMIARLTAQLNERPKYEPYAYSRTNVDTQGVTPAEQWSGLIDRKSGQTFVRRADHERIVTQLTTERDAARKAVEDARGLIQELVVYTPDDPANNDLAQEWLARNPVTEAPK